MLPSNRFSAKVCCLIVVRVCDQIRTSCSDSPLHSDLPSHNDSAANQCRSLPFSPAGDERGCARRTTTSPPSPISLSHTGKRSGRLFAGTAQQGDQTSYQRRRGLPHPAALQRLAGSVLVEAHDEWQVADKRYLSKPPSPCSDPPRTQATNPLPSPPLSRHRVIRPAQTHQDTAPSATGRVGGRAPGRPRR